MKVTKYPQSCLVVESDGRILIDPGFPAMDATPVDAFGTVDAVLVTHRHADHVDRRAIDPLRDRGVPVYGNADVAALLGDPVTVVTDGAALQVAGFEVVPRDLAHQELVDGSPGPPNTGFLLDGRLFHPGDGLALPGLRADVLAVPIAGPSTSFRDAHRFLETTGATRAVPVHYDVFIADPDLFADKCTIADVIVLAAGESAEA